MKNYLISFKYLTICQSLKYYQFYNNLRTKIEPTDFYNGSVTNYIPSLTYIKLSSPSYLNTNLYVFLTKK